MKMVKMIIIMKKMKIKIGKPSTFFSANLRINLVYIVMKNHIPFCLHIKYLLKWRILCMYNSKYIKDKQLSFIINLCISMLYI